MRATIKIPSAATRRLSFPTQWAAGGAVYITERKRAEEALRERGELQAFLLKLSDAVIIPCLHPEDRKMFLEAMNKANNPKSNGIFHLE